MYQQEDYAGMQQLFQDPRRHPTPPAITGSQGLGSATPALPNLSSFGSPVAIKNEPAGGQPSSSTILSFGALPAASTLNFSSGGEAWPDVTVEGVPPERRSRSHSSTPEHVVSERKRREKMQQQFVALATMVPDLTKVK
jgi:hypothetical protein